MQPAERLEKVCDWSDEWYETQLNKRAKCTQTRTIFVDVWITAIRSGWNTNLNERTDPGGLLNILRVPACPRPHWSLIGSITGVKLSRCQSRNATLDQIRVANETTESKGVWWVIFVKARSSSLHTGKIYFGSVAQFEVHLKIGRGYHVLLDKAYSGKDTQTRISPVTIHQCTAIGLATIRGQHIAIFTIRFRMHKNHVKSLSSRVLMNGDFQKKKNKLATNSDAEQYLHQIYIRDGGHDKTHAWLPSRCNSCTGFWARGSSYRNE